MGLSAWLLLSAALFSTGLFGLLTRKHAIGLLLSVELMANAVNLNLVAFGFFRGDLMGQVIALFGIALTVAEVVVGLGLIIQLHRHNKAVDVDAAREMAG